MKFTITVVQILLLCLLLSQAWVSQSIAKGSAELFDLTLEELMAVDVYSAGKQEQAIVNIPASVVIMTRREIELYGYQTVADVLRNVAGLYYTYTYNEDVLGVRGLLRGKIVLLVNGVVQHDNQLKHIGFVSEIIDRIEIVRGPMSVIHGDGAFLGSINIITNQKDNGLNLVSLGFGARQHNKAYLSSSVEQGGFELDFNAAYYDTAGLNASYKDMMSRENFANLHPQMHLTTKDDLERTNKYLSLDFDNSHIYGSIQYNQTLNEWYLGSPSFHQGNQEKSTAVTSMFGYTHQIAQDFSLDTRLIYSKGSEARDYDFLEPELDASRYVSRKRWESEFLFTYRYNEAWDGIFGFNYKNIADGTYDLQIPPWDLDVHITDDDSVTHALFAQVNYAATDKLSVVAGLRMEKQYGYFTHRIGRDDVPSGVAEINGDDDEYVIPRVALLYMLDNRHVVKFLYGEATRTDTNIGSDINDFDTRVTIDTVELNHLYSGINYSLSTSLFVSQANHLNKFYQQIVDDELVFFFDDSVVLRNKGIEFSASYRPMPTLSFDFSLTMTQTQDKSNKVDIGFEPALTSKFRVSYQQGNASYAISANYTGKMLNDWKTLDENGAALRVGDNLKATMDLKLNLRYQYPDSGYCINLTIDNLLNREIRYFGSQDATFQRNPLGPRRSIFLSVGRQF